MNRILRKCRNFLSLRNREKVWFVFLFILSAWVRLLILTLPFRRIAPCLGAHYQNHQLAAIASKDQLYTAWRIGRVTELATKYTPWQSKCLVQAILARILLGYYSIPYVMHLGVRKSAPITDIQQEENILKAHAWLSVGPRIITGREGHRAFAIVATFIQPSLLGSADKLSDRSANSGSG